MAGVKTEVWARDIAKNLFKSNAFIMRSRDESQYVNNDIVHKPQSGAAPTVVKNRTTIPATPSQRADTTVDYPLSSFSSNPTVIRDIEEKETSYNKRMDVLEDHISAIEEVACDDILGTWAATDAANIVRTTGASRPAAANGATGNRKKLTLADILAAKTKMDADKIPQEGRVMLVPADMYADLLEIDEIVSAEKFGRANLPDGAVNRIFGFDVYLRAQALVYDNAATPAPVTAPAADNNSAVLCWHERFTCRAKGSVKVFVQEDAPEYFGSIFSAEAKAGGTPHYTNKRGIVSIVQDVA